MQGRINHACLKVSFQTGMVYFLYSQSTLRKSAHVILGLDPSIPKFTETKDTRVKPEYDGKVTT
ncbi:hypothetical protein [Neisseria wadsworthii]|uniref:Uncharacterized protein n=1 Tax=Neisseria wadsworthii 9715 TaxID=1030841 RepID=G4CLR8_9NEIS|nr:hypothetical protein [Neisseria wadsworthii]EGZ51276.1 hypothetical protein HMPREF9370_0027 [Neisseria wadsworthii 9715]QMT36114.1 hypothetical protein H3L96_02385 [Neisseria wadsworthii]